MPKLPRLSDYKNILVQREFFPGDKEFTYFLEIPFEHIAEMKISVANWQLVNLSSGLIRHLTDEEGKIFEPDGVKIVDGKLITNSFEKRIFHWDYNTHMRELKILDGNGNVIVPAYVNGWRDLGQNPWHLLWEKNPSSDACLKEDGKVANGHKQKDRLLRLYEDEKYGITRYGDLSTGRVYSCLVVPREGKPHIRELRFDENQEVYSSRLEQILSEEIEWTASGKPLIKDGLVLSIYDIVEQYYDPAHVFPVSDHCPEYINGSTERPRKGELIQRLYNGYPEKFRANCIKALDEGLGTARYYFDIVGVSAESLIILHKYGTLSEVAKAAIEKGMKDAIIVDEGGSVGIWAWYHGPNGGFESCSSYLRPSAIAVLGIKLNLS